jgi:hypothetical protein
MWKTKTETAKGIRRKLLAQAEIKVTADETLCLLHPDPGNGDPEARRKIATEIAERMSWSSLGGIASPRSIADRQAVRQRPKTECEAPPQETRR